MFGILGSIDVGSGQTYPTFDDLFKDLKARMSKDGYKVVKSRTHRNKVAGNYEKGSEVVRCDLVCDRGGQPYKCTATQLKTTTKKTNCPWRAKAVNRKTLGAWVLTVLTNEHNHEPRTPEPPTDEEDADADADGDAEIIHDDGDMSIEPLAEASQTPSQAPAQAHIPTPDATFATPASGNAPTADADESMALAVAGVSSSSLRLSGETFHQLKGEYRRMSKPERIGILARMQLRIAAIYAIENEDQQRQERQARQERKHQEMGENNRRRTLDQQHTQHTQQNQQAQQLQQAQTQQAPQMPQAQHVHHQHPQHQHHPQQHQQQQHHHQQLQQQQQMAQFAQMSGGPPKHPFQQTPEEEQAQVQERRRHINQMAREHMGTPVQQAPMQPSPMTQPMQQPPVQTPVPVPQFGMQSAPGSQNIFRYAGTPQQPSGAGTPVTAPPKRRGRPKNVAKNVNGAS